MSESIWTQCAGTSEIGPLRSRPWRVVEAQHVIATRKLVDSTEEHDLLEELIEAAKPPESGIEHSDGLHYLLLTPFRYPPLRHGSRFGRRDEPGIWYGSETLAGAFAEVAYYRLRFLEDSAADLKRLEVPLSAFLVSVQTSRGVDLTLPPFRASEALISSPVSYTDSQQLGREMRTAGVEAFRYRSARGHMNSDHLALFSPAAFAEKRPETPETWHCTATQQAVDFVRHGYFEPSSESFRREVFLIDGELPRPN